MERKKETLLLRHDKLPPHWRRWELVGGNDLFNAWERKS